LLGEEGGDDHMYNAKEGERQGAKELILLIRLLALRVVCDANGCAWKERRQRNLEKLVSLMIWCLLCGGWCVVEGWGLATTTYTTPRSEHRGVYP
jgi:hypothetical protein